MRISSTTWHHSRLVKRLFTAVVSLSAVLASIENSGQAADLPRPVQVPDGYEVEVVAGPPLVNRPISAAFDEWGRLYVTDSSGSNENVKIQLKKRPHRIVRLEDTDGDGRFDKSVVFADKMMFPAGAMWLEGSLYVTAPPHIWKLTDTDDDGVADQREIWFDAKTLTHCANDLHGPYRGLDGWVYWCKGAFAQQTYARPGKKDFVTRAAHIFRRRPEGGPVEHVMTGGMDNPVDVVFTRGGERLFTTTFLQHPAPGKRDGIIHAIYGGVYGKKQGAINGHIRTGKLMTPLVHLGAAAPCGMTRLKSTELGKGFRDSLLACQFNMHKVSRHILVSRGATFVSQNEDLLTCKHIDFHPTDVLEDADGSVLVVDTGGWYKLCCPTSRLHKPNVLGAIYRIRKKGKHKVSDPRGRKLDWTALTVEQLAPLLSDARPAVRSQAQDLLVASGKKAVPALAKAVKHSSPEVRIRAAWALGRIDDPAARKAVRSALKDSDGDVRQAAIHSVSVLRDEKAVAPLIDLLKNKSLHNRRSAAEALGRIGDSKAVGALLAASTNYGGRVLEHSFVYALVEIGDAKLTRPGLIAESPHTRRAALLAIDAMAGEKLDTRSIVSLLDGDDPVLADTAWWITIRHPEWADTMVDHLRKQVDDKKLPAASLRPLAQHLARFSASPKVQAVMAGGLSDPNVPASTKLAILDAITASRQKRLPKVWSVQITKLLVSSDPSVVAKTVAAVHAYRTSRHSASMMAGLTKVATNEKFAIETRLAALATSTKGGAIDDAVILLLTNELPADRPVRNRSLAIDVLLAAKLEDRQLVSVAAVLDKAVSMDLARLLPVFAKTKSQQVGHQLVTALSKSSAATALDAKVVRNILGRFGDSVSKQAAPLMKKIDAASQQKQARLEAVLALVKQGDVRRGQEIFHSSKAACAACHSFGYVGGKIGPDLTRIGVIRDERSLLESILYPSATFVRSYEPVVIVTNSGKIYSGVAKNETRTEIVLSLDAQKVVRIAIDDIETRSPGKISIMPEGLDKQFTPQQLADLIMFLKTAR